MQGPWSDRIWSSTKSGYVNAPCSSDQTKSLTFGWKSQSSNKNGESAKWCFFLFFCLCWGLTSQSTIFQSYRDGATASWVINQYFRGVKCLAQRHNTAAVGLEPPTSRSGVRHSTTEPPRSPAKWCKLVNRWKLDYYKNLEFIMIANMWWKKDKPCSSRALLFVEILTPLGKVSQNTAPSFLENLNLWCASFRRFVFQK